MQLYEHQKSGIKFLKTAKYALLGDECGLGKSLQAILAVKDLPGTKVIVCPAMLRNTWQDELEKFCPEISVEIVKGKNPNYSKIRVNIFTIMSYESISNHPRDLKIAAIIFDESHYLKNLAAKRTQNAHQLIRHHLPQMCVLLSGTPIKNNATEFYSPLRMLSYCPYGTNGEKVTEKSQYAFSIRFSNPHTRTIYTPNGGTVEVTEFKGIRNKERLKGYLKGKYLRRKASKVLDLPEIVDKEIILGNTKWDKLLTSAYEEAEAGNKSDHIMKVKIDSALSKVGATINYVTDLVSSDEQVVLFTAHRDPAKELFDGLKGKLRVEVLTGETDTDLRNLSVKKFQAGELDVLVLTIGACSTGITLTKARHLVYNDISWSYTDMIQSRGRIHRISQNSTCFIHYILNSTIDKWLKRKVMEKAKNLKEIL